MTVYIELLIIDNFVFDFLIAYITLTFLKSKRHILCLLLSATIGTIFAVFFPYIPRYLLFLYKIVALLLSTIVLKRPKSLKDYLAVVLVYMITSTTLAGIIVLIFNMKATSIYGTFVYDKGGLIAVLSLAVLIALYSARQIIGLYNTSHTKDLIVDTEIITSSISLNIKGLLDTGNRLVDENGQGIVVLSKTLSKRLENTKKGREVLISTINGQNVFDTIIIDQLKIYYKDKVNTINNVTAALTDRELEKFDIILFKDS